METSRTGLTERLSLIAGEKALASVGARLEDLVDPDVRGVVIRADHPELDRALRDGKDELIVDGEPMSIRLHLTMHQALANQLADNDPPEVYLTAQRLLASGYERHEVLHMLAAPIAEQIHATLHDGKEYDRDRHLAALAALPGSWGAAAHNQRPSTRTRAAVTLRGDIAAAERAAIARVPAYPSEAVLPSTGPTGSPGSARPHHPREVPRRPRTR